MGAVTNYCKLGGLKQHQHALTVLKLKVWVTGLRSSCWQDQGPLEAPVEGVPTLASWSLWRLPVLLGLWPQGPISSPGVTDLLFCGCLGQSRLPPSYKVKAKVVQLCPTLCDPVGSRVPGILQARTLEWVAFPFSRGSSQPRDQSQVSRIAGGFFTCRATRESPL